ncbi:SDR family oxidoreductase [Actinocatenispora sera]|uniref:3-oxoacyl-ACP reductase n=1 Tax=Actinocatenispora sera TaxID=390989 RepID=A0A810L4E0_9ACTN|nr:SDR family oxidoreductase [Actinocatenispora sera]BCJ29266.1 3-oxoacyl-ACP reductase [Actinocatenispora sera]
MVDRYQRLTSAGPGRAIARRLGLPRPAVLPRRDPARPAAVPGPIVLAGPAGPHGPADSDSATTGDATGRPTPGPAGDVAGAAAGDVAGGAAGARAGGAGATGAGAGAGADESSGGRAGAGGGAAEGGGELADAVRAALAGTGVELVAAAEHPAALVYDASGLADATQLGGLREFLGPRVRSVCTGGRVLVLSRPPAEAPDVASHVARRALTGFVRSLGKEVGRGVTVSLLRVAAGGESSLDSTLRFLLSPRSAYVSGQVIDIGPASAGGADSAAPGERASRARSTGGVESAASVLGAESAGGAGRSGSAGGAGRSGSGVDDLERPLAGRTALVTGAAQGIGAAIAETLAADGATVVCLDVPAQGETLAAVANRVGGSSLHLDITAEGAPRELVEYLTQRYDGADIVVHNAGVLRDRTLAKMTEGEWDTVLSVNLLAPQRLTAALLDAPAALRPGARIVCLSSLNGIAGAAGQTNYAASKAGVIGLVEAYAPVLAQRGVTINAVAPGFIETRMTASMPLTVREVGRRANSLAQGGLPVDVAEAVSWLAAPGSGGITGQTVRVCGQSLLGA